MEGKKVIHFQYAVEEYSGAKKDWIHYNYIYPYYCLWQDVATGRWELWKVYVNSFYPGKIVTSWAVRPTEYLIQMEVVNDLRKASGSAGWVVTNYRKKKDPICPESRNTKVEYNKYTVKYEPKTTRNG
jgi:hypothetical protein